MNLILIVSIVELIYCANLVSSNFAIQTKANSTVFTEATVCKFPAFLRAALGIACVEKVNDRLWFTQGNAPARKLLEVNQTCEKDRYEWPGENGTTVCCLDLQCPAGQILAKDDRNTGFGECPKCRNVVYEYICDPLNDTCSQFHGGSTCRHFFNSTTLFICACDSAHGFTQNRLTFPVTCTKTIGAVCFLPEHCTMVDPNSHCEFGNHTAPPKGKCECQSGFILDKHGRCQNDNITTKMLVKRDTSANWNDKNNWQEGAIENAYFRSQRQDKNQTKVILVENIAKVADEKNSSRPNRTFEAISPSNSSTPSPVIISAPPQPQAFMISSALLNASAVASALSSPNSGKVTSVPILSSSEKKSNITNVIETLSKNATMSSLNSSSVNPVSSTAVSGTKFASEDGDSQIDDKLNILRPAKRKLQTDRPTTSSTWDVSVRPTLTETATTKFTPYWARESTPSSPDTTSQTSTRSTSTISGVRNATIALNTTTVSPKPVANQTSSEPPSTGRNFEIFANTRKTRTTTVAPQTSSVGSKLLTEATTEQRQTSTRASSLVTTSSTTSVSTTRPASSTTSATTTKASTPPSSATSAATTILTTTRTSTTPSTTSSTTQRTTTPQTSPSTAMRVSPSTASSSTAAMKPDLGNKLSIPFQDGAGTIRFNSDGNKRFSGVASGGVEKLVLDGQEIETSKAVATTSSSRPSPSARTTSVSLSTLPTTTAQQPTSKTAEKVAVDFSFLKDSSLSKADLQKRLLQALLDLSATTQPPTTTTTRPTTPAFDLSFLNNPNLSPSELEQRLLPLLASFREQAQSSTTGAPLTTTKSSTPALTTTLSTSTQRAETTSLATRVVQIFTQAPAFIRRVSTSTTKPVTTQKVVATTTAPSTRQPIVVTTAASTARKSIATDAASTSTKKVTAVASTEAKKANRPLAGSKPVDLGSFDQQQAFVKFLQGKDSAHPFRKEQARVKAVAKRRPALIQKRPKPAKIGRPANVRKGPVKAIFRRPAAAAVHKRKKAPISRKKIFLMPDRSIGRRPSPVVSNEFAPQATNPSRPQPTEEAIPSKPKKTFSIFNAFWSKSETTTQRTTTSTTTTEKPATRRSNVHKVKFTRTRPTGSRRVKPERTTTQAVIAVTKPTTPSTTQASSKGGSSVPGFGQVFSGLGSLFGGLFGSKRRSTPPPLIDNQETIPVTPALPLPGKGGKLDLSDPRAQLQLAKLLQQKTGGEAPPSPLTNPLASAAAALKDFSKPKTLADASKKFSFDNPDEQVAFVKFLQNYDKYQPAPSKSSGPSPLFPRPPPVADQPEWQRPTTQPPTIVTTTPHAEPKSDQFSSVNITPDIWNLIQQMQKPGLFNVTQEQLASLQPILKHLQAEQTKLIESKTQPPPPQSKPDRQVVWGGDADPFGYDSFGGGAVPPVPPVTPRTWPTEPTTITSTTTTSTTTTTTTASPTTTKNIDGQGKSFVPSDNVNQVAAPVVKPPKQPPFVQEPVKCPVVCQQQDPNSVCDTRFGNCICQPGYRNSFLEGNICTKNLFSLCSTDEDCKSGGDFNSECAFNGENRFCTCSNGYLPEADGTCKPMFNERCTKSCSQIPNAVCDPVKGICKCPTGYAWFKDPWTSQPVCRAALGGSVPCRAEQDLCPVYSPRGKCRNNVFCGCEDGYIPDSWFTNHSERTACIDVLSAKCEDNSECTAADRNTLCDRRLRMCVCKPGYKPDPSHNAPCMVDPAA